ncbi:MAG: hypothetical protein J6A30_09325 [Ruminococcus sp.]|nr:hypothetical protein [Ruminococcus sp.]
MAKLSYTAAEIDALLEKVATNGDDIEAIIAAFPFAMQRGEYTLNDQSELTFDTLTDTKYYRYTASAIGNPVSGGYGIIINIRYTAYAVQILFSQTTATAPTQMLYRIGTNMSTTPTWKEWQTAGGSESFAIKKLTYTGDGNLTNQITFPSLPKMILKITGRGSQAPILETVNIIYNQDTEYYTQYLDSSSSSTWKAEHGSIVYSGNTMTLTTTSSAASGALNTNNQEYTVFYV